MADFDRKLGEQLEQGMLRLFQEGKSEQEVGDWAADVIIKASEDSAPAVVKSLRRAAPRMLREHRKLAAGFDHRLRRDWGTGLDLMYAAIVACGEAGQEFYVRQDTIDSQVEVLAGLHARAWRTAMEAHLLLSHGFPAGGMARARTLHELAVVAGVISGFGRQTGNEDLAERYLLHGSVMAYKESLSYQAHADSLGYKKMTDEEMSEMQTERAALLQRFGASFASDNGWASEVSGNKAPRFIDLEKLAELSHLRPYYTWASHSVHADSRGLALNQIEYRGHRVMVAGPTNVGLADPAQLSLDAFLQCTVSLLLSPVDGPTSVMDQLALHSLLLLIKEAKQELADVEPKIKAREALLADSTVADGQLT